MKNIVKFFRPNLRLVKGSRLTSALFIGASMALAAGIIFGANIYYDIDTSKIMIEDAQQATTTQITANTGSTALTVTQRGTGAAFSATSTSSMSQDIFKITNLGSGKSFVVEDSDTDSNPFVVDANGNVGVASSTPSANLGVQGNVMIAGGILQITTTTATSTAGSFQFTQIKVTGPIAPVDGYVLTATDALGNVQWEAVPTGVWTSSGGNLYPTTQSDNVAIATTTARYDLDVWGDFAVGTSTDYATPALFVNSGDGGRIGIGTTTLVGLLTVGTSTPRFVVAPNGFVGVATSTPSDTFAVGGNIIGSGNLVVYGLSTSTFGGGIRTGGDIAATGGPVSIYLTSAGALTLQPQSNSNVVVQLGGTGQLKIGSSGQFYIDASGNATTSGNIYASAFISTGSNAYTRKVGDEIVRGVVPIFGFDLPVRCKTSCNSGTATATISRVVENDDDIFPSIFTGTTRKYRFSIRYADATTTAGIRTTWDVATSSDRSYTSRFTLPPTDTTDLAAGYATTTNFVTLPTTDDWFLRVSTGGSGNYELQVYEILLIGIDQVN